jgi:lipoprotein-anchoring transpeptidase ErfK/SrfK
MQILAIAERALIGVGRVGATFCPARERLRGRCIFLPEHLSGRRRFSFNPGFRIWGMTMESRVCAGLLLAAFLLAPASAFAGISGPDDGGSIYKSSNGNVYQAPSIPRTEVNYPNNHKPGTVVVNTQERRLYLVLDQRRALRYGIGVGRDGFRWGGTHTVTMKREWPDWSPPPQMLRREPDLPRWMPGGLDNPLGARALYLGSTIYRIHGSNEPETIGQAVSSGCFRMTNDDVTDLYERVKLGAKVIVLL